LCSLGGWAFFVALSVYAYDAGGASLVGVAAVVRMAPAALAAPAMAMLGDRYSRRNVLVALAVARAWLLAGAAAVVWAGGPVVVVFALAAVFTAVGTGHRPAQAALLPSLADDPRQLTACNAVWSAVDSVGFLAGALAAGVLIAAGGTDLALFATAIAFAFAALGLAGIPPDRPDARLVRAPGAGRWDELAEGLRTVAAEPRLRLVVAVLGASTLAEGVIDVLVVLVALELLDLGAAGVGWLNSAWGAGGVIGGASAVVLITRGCNATALLIGAFFVGVPLIVLTVAPSVPVAVAGLVVLGVGYATIEVAGLTLVQRLAADAVLARAFGVVEGTYWLTTGIGSLLAPVLVAVAGLEGALLLVGVLFPLVVLARWRALWRIEAATPVPAAEYDLLRGVGILAPLPIIALEELALHATHRPFSAGTTIIREGEPGEHFYVIAAGEVEVTEGGRFRRTEVSGECFGEIALLREVPRTATVVARTDVDLLALERDEFLAAVTGDRRALAAGHDLVEARLAAV
jgi:MFS family permease